MSYTIATIRPVCEKLHKEGKSIVLATGFFDLLHDEHIKFLQKAKAAGDVLIVAIESDARARALKGEGRPIEPQPRRAQHILDLALADYCVLLGDDFNNPAAYESLLAALHPQIYAVSGHTDHQEHKQAMVEKYGGHLLVVHDWNPAVSTTKRLQENHV